MWEGFINVLWIAGIYFTLRIGIVGSIDCFIATFGFFFDLEKRVEFERLSMKFLTKRPIVIQ